VVSALDSGKLDTSTVEWARGKVAVALHRSPSLCDGQGANAFTWSRLQLSPPPADSQLAFQVLRFAYDDPYEAEISQLCSRLGI
jgi:hypothetical protein